MKKESFYSGIINDLSAVFKKGSYVMDFFEDRDRYKPRR
jgi:hypothetical protein